MHHRPVFADLTGKTALVTGCGSPDGIGFATARLLGRQGAAVVITSTTDRILDRAAELAEEEIEAKAIVADLLAPGSPGEVVEEAIAWHSRLDILVNNAGMVQMGGTEEDRPFAEIPEADFRANLELNLELPINVTRAALEALIEAPEGRIIFISSVTGPLVSTADSSSYSAAKAGVDGFMKSLAIELGPTATTVNSVNPGWIKTSSSPDSEVQAGQYTPLGRPGTADEVAAAVLLLASPEASYITGQALVVDGGNVIQEEKGP